ncbi:MAG: Asp-tRNA(Asn)/Glu-tRNA(Gln) amidotransferase subunit GatB [Pseudomonadota bacterium]
MTKYETIIGLEVHAQLKTASKMFCSCATSFGDEPNTNICPVCTGQPGTLPVVNESAITMAIRAGLALGCDIHKKSVFARKNYFYPDLPKGYQISQYELPLCTGGSLNIRTQEERKLISLTRIHLEEDAGKLLHDYGHADMSHVDFNRCGVPLIEIVSGPDMRSPKEAGDYLRTLRNVLVYLDICEGNLQEGNFRCDANVSIRPFGQKKFGTRTEMKNLNSFKAVERALAFETLRQTEVLDSGGIVIQETRLWNDALQKTETMRTKEEAHDYRYFPDPDLLPLIVNEQWIDKVRSSLPELACAKADRFVRDYGIREDEAAILTDEKALADYFESVIAAGARAKKAANWILAELLRELKEEEEGIKKCPVTPSNLAKLIGLIEDGKISGKIAKEIFAEMYKNGKTAENIVKEKGLEQISDSSEIETVIDKIIADSTKQVQQYKDGKANVFGYFVGQVMKATKGQANPNIVNELLKKKLN